MKRLPLPRLKIGRKAKTTKSSKQLPDGVPTGKQLLAELMVVFGVIILGVGSFLWWHYIYSSPKNVLQGVLSSALTTPSNTIRTTQKSDDQTLDQTVRLNVQGQHLASGKTLLTQGSASSVTTETIGTPSIDYIRYIDVKTAQQTAEGKPLNFSKLLNIWGKSDGDPNQTSGDLYNQSVLGLIPYANLNAAQRKEVLGLMKPAYNFDNNQVEKHIVNGRPVYEYNVQVKPKEYVIMLKRFGALTGLTQLEQIDPNSYDSAAPISFILSVDVWSRHATSIRYPKSDRQEFASGWGIVSPPTVLPKDTITINELQSRLQTLQ